MIYFIFYLLNYIFIIAFFLTLIISCSPRPPPPFFCLFYFLWWDGFLIYKAIYHGNNKTHKHNIRKKNAVSTMLMQNSKYTITCFFSIKQYFYLWEGELGPNFSFLASKCASIQYLYHFPVENHNFPVENHNFHWKS